MYICRRLFVVLLADNNHGKSTIIRSMVSQAVGSKIDHHRKGQRNMITPWGRQINAYVFGRSYQEVERNRFGSIHSALEGNDSDWRNRELVVMPSHIGSTDIIDIQQIIDIAHATGFDAIAAAVVYETDTTDNRAALQPALTLNWDARWTILNPHRTDPDGQLWALGNDLWSWISRTLVQ